MVCKIGIKIGQVEINYEGEEAFFREELPKIILEVSHLAKNKELIEKPTKDPDIAPDIKNPGKKLDISVKTIAAKMGQKTGPDLILAAAAYLTFVDNTESFTKAELAKAMRTAPALNKKSYTNNFGAYIERLVAQQELTQNSSGKYALSSNSLAKLGNLLGN
jgi:hypothetical protein